MRREMRKHVKIFMKFYIANIVCSMALKIKHLYTQGRFLGLKKIPLQIHARRDYKIFQIHTHTHTHRMRKNGNERNFTLNGILFYMKILMKLNDYEFSR